MARLNLHTDAEDVTQFTPLVCDRVCFALPRNVTKWQYALIGTDLFVQYWTDNQSHRDVYRWRYQPAPGRWPVFAEEGGPLLGWLAVAEQQARIEWLPPAQRSLADVIDLERDETP